MHKFVLKKLSSDVELDIKWRVVMQKSSTRGQLIAQICQEKVVVWCRIRRKMTSRCAKIVNKKTCRRHVDAQSCLEKDVSWRRIRRKVTGRLAKMSTRWRLNAQICLKKTSRDVELDAKWRVVVQKSSTRGRVEDVLVRKVLKKTSLWRRIRRKVRSRRAKIVNKRTTHCANLSRKSCLVVSN